MKRFFLIGSLVLNGILAAAIWMKPDLSVEDKTTPPPLTTVQAHPQEVELLAKANNILVAPAEPFHWSLIQSTNFVEYAEKLHDLECPPQTIRDIIIGEINDWMLAQRRALFAPYAPRFWEFAAKDDTRTPEELEQPLGELKKAKAELLAQALGKIPQPEQSPKVRPDPDLEILSDEKRKQLQEIYEKYNGLLKELLASARSSGVDPHERRQELEKQREAEKQALMSAEELAEYKLQRESWQFPRIYGFEAGEEELRKIAAVYARNPIWPNDPDFPADRDGQKARANQREDELKAMLGEKRLAELKRGSEPAYVEAFTVAQVYKLPEETAGRAYEMSQELKAQTKTLQNNSSLTPEQRDEALQELYDATSDALVELYGEEAAKALRLKQSYRMR